MLHHSRGNKDQYTMEKHNAFSTAGGRLYALVKYKEAQIKLNTHLKGS